MAANVSCFIPDSTDFGHCCEHGVEVKPFAFLFTPAIVFSVLDYLKLKQFEREGLPIQTSSRPKSALIEAISTFLVVTSIILAAAQIANICRTVSQLDIDGAWHAYEAYALLISGSSASAVLGTLISTIMIDDAAKQLDADIDLMAPWNRCNVFTTFPLVFVILSSISPAVTHGLPGAVIFLMPALFFIAVVVTACTHEARFV
eukprot:TRINITY_DN12085_c5_g5_i1.p1 TRINITY_DN12085_c5_g5~~TRINITY_DN12085_c5_g5_i1.p1  ORF type:complete len:203 (+),score=19.13 TRINITY_DN12085_c5_g5_i1:237-845(+)